MMEHGRYSFGMFGFFRFFLASCIVVGYAGPEHYYLFYQGVYAFVLLAAYVNSRQYAEYYSGRKNGLALFALNRVLRIYPVYYALLPFGIFVAYQDSNASFSMFRNFQYFSPSDPQYTLGWLSSFVIFGLAHFDGTLAEPSFIAHGWAMSIGLLFTLLTPLLVKSRDARVALLFTAVYYSCAVAMLMVMDPDAGWKDTAMFGLYSGAMPFALGLYAYLLGRSGALRLPPAVGLASVLLLPYFMVVQADLLDAYLVGFWVVLVLTFLCVNYLSRLDAMKFPYWVRSMDNFFGGVAYPFVLAVVPVGAFIAWKCPEMYDTDENGFLFYRRPWELLGYVMPVAFMLGCVLWGLVELPVAQLRARVRALAKPKF